MKNLTKAVISVMKAVNGIEKNTTVGSGRNSYKGVNDKDVKAVYKKAMEDNGLCILPISINETTDVVRWEEKTDYGMKKKQSVFTKVNTKYLLLHESGESIEIAGYGHGVDSSDKGAGKATTYAMKYALLYSFMTPTGDIDDSDKTHSDDVVKPPSRKTLTKDKIEKTIEWCKSNGKGIDFLESTYDFSKEVKEMLIEGLKNEK